MKTRLFALIAVSVALVGGSLAFAEKAENKVKLEGVKCPVSGKPAVEAQAVDYKGAKVYLCCEGCKDKVSEHAAAANAQLVSTGQFKQKACPLTGKACKADKVVEVGGAKVAFCCDGCKGKVAGLKGEEQIKTVFADATFEKGFEAAKK